MKTLMRHILNILASNYLLFFDSTKINYKKILKKIKMLVKNKKVLDVGCGLGIFSYEISKYASFVDAIDIDPNVLECSKKSNNIKYILSSIENYNVNKKYDLIICLQVLEHIKNDKYVFKKIVNLLKKGGYILISTPNKNKFINHNFKIKRLFKKFFPNVKSCELLKDKPHGHERLGYNKQDFEFFATENNLKIVDVFYEDSPIIIYEIFFLLPNFLRIFLYPIFSFINKVFTNLNNKDGLSIYILFRKL